MMRREELPPILFNQNYYEIFSLDPNSFDEKKLRHSFRRLAKQWHPDKNQSTFAAEAFKRIKRAHETLSDEEKRYHYNNQLNKENGNIHVRIKKKKTEDNINDSLSSHRTSYDRFEERKRKYSRKKFNSQNNILKQQQHFDDNFSARLKSAANKSDIYGDYLRYLQQMRDTFSNGYTASSDNESWKTYNARFHEKHFPNKKIRRNMEKNDSSETSRSSVHVQEKEKTQSKVKRKLKKYSNNIDQFPKSSSSFDTHSSNHFETSSTTTAPITTPVILHPIHKSDDIIFRHNNNQNNKKNQDHHNDENHISKRKKSNKILKRKQIILEPIHKMRQEINSRSENDIRAFRQINRKFSTFTDMLNDYTNRSRCVYCKKMEFHFETDRRKHETECKRKFHFDTM
ncbi:hypothetical protein SNEBB_006214 [Seison nebaliae]|nr:hypothetical protein SNEBB_006214 [Seison nebaliae]